MLPAANADKAELLRAVAVPLEKKVAEEKDWLWICDQCGTEGTSSDKLICGYCGRRMRRVE